MLIPHDRLLANYTFEDLLTPLKSFSHVQHQREAMDYTNLHVDIYQANTYLIISRINAIYILCCIVMSRRSVTHYVLWLVDSPRQYIYIYIIYKRLKK
jgi:hypothetical protein